MSIRNHRLLFVLALAVVATLCCSWDAPRDNRFDPNLGGNLSGRVLTRRATPIAGATIGLPCAGRLIETDLAGRFELHSLPEESAWVCVSADGYAYESTRVELAKGVIDSLTLYLNGLPLLSGCQVASHVYGRGWPPQPLEFCTLTAAAGDIDGGSDVDSVWVEIPSLGLTQRLSYDPDRQVFTQTLRADDLPGQGLEALVGQEVRFNVTDFESTTVAMTMAGINRIIAHLPELEFPSSGEDTLSGDTVFSWHPFDHGYAVRYHGQIVRIEGGSPAGVAAEFEADDTTWQFSPALLQSGDYYWTIEAIDEFGNSSRSAEEVFYAR